MFHRHPHKICKISARQVSEKTNTDTLSRYEPTRGRLVDGLWAAGRAARLYVAPLSPPEVERRLDNHGPRGGGRMTDQPGRGSGSGPQSQDECKHFEIAVHSL